MTKTLNELRTRKLVRAIFGAVVMQPPGKPQEAYRFFEKGSIGAFVLIVVLVLLLNPTTNEIAKRE